MLMIELKLLTTGWKFLEIWGEISGKGRISAGYNVKVVFFFPRELVFRRSPAPLES